MGTLFNKLLYVLSLSSLFVILFGCVTTDKKSGSTINSSNPQQVNLSIQENDIGEIDDPFLATSEFDKDEFDEPT